MNGLTALLNWKASARRAWDRLDYGSFPASQGRTERCFGTLQDRLVKALRQATISRLEDTNRFLEETYLPEWNRRFRREPDSRADAHRAVLPDRNLASILRFVEEPTIAHDYAIRLDGAALSDLVTRGEAAHAQSQAAHRTTLDWRTGRPLAESALRASTYEGAPGRKVAS